MYRIDRDTLHSAISLLMASRATCTRARVGCVFVKDGRIIVTGYNGAPSGMPHCTDEGCIISPETGGCDRCIHAEAGAISFAARHGISLEGSSLYITHSPCPSCAKLLVNSGVKKVVYRTPYRESALQYLVNAGLEVAQIG